MVVLVRPVLRSVSMTHLADAYAILTDLLIDARSVPQAEREQARRANEVLRRAMDYIRWQNNSRCWAFDRVAAGFSTIYWDPYYGN